jgi:hypothetical protein
MAGHIRAAAWLRIVWSALGLLLTLAGLLYFRSAMRPLVRDIARSMVQQQRTSGDSSDTLPDVDVDALVELALQSATVVFVVLLVLEVPGLIVGWGLLNYRPWARPLNIACSLFDLLSIPIGTAIGAYSLWVMFRPETAALFRHPPESGPALL